MKMRLTQVPVNGTFTYQCGCVGRRTAQWQFSWMGEQRSYTPVEVLYDCQFGRQARKRPQVLYVPACCAVEQEYDSYEFAHVEEVDCDPLALALEAKFA